MEHKLTQSEARREIVSADTGLTALQEKGAILMASGVRISDVARELGVHRGTLYRWLNLIAFQCFYNLMKQDVKNYLEGSVMELHAQALDGLRSSLESSNEAIKLRASVWVIDKIGRMEVGKTDVRGVLRDQSESVLPFGTDTRYNEALDDAGLDP